MLRNYYQIERTKGYQANIPSLVFSNPATN
jgi:hypothetical protein